METVDSYSINLNDLQMDGVLECPYCGKGKDYSYGGKGQHSCPCGVCKNIVLWNFDKMKAYKVRARKFAS